MMTLEDLKKSQNNIIITHYSTTDRGVDPIKVTSISIREFQSGNIQSFTVNQNFDERNILESFIDHLEKYTNYFIVTWNQKKPQYGLPHLKSQCKSLEITKQFPFDENEIIDLDGLLQKKYHEKYVDHPKLKTISELNNLDIREFVDGKDEIVLFNNKKFQKLTNSTVCKVSAISKILKLDFECKLKVKRRRNMSFNSTYGKYLGYIGAAASIISVVYFLIIPLFKP